MTVTEPDRRVTADDFYDVPLPEEEPSPFHDNGDKPSYIPFAGLTHAEVLALEFAEERMLVDDLVPLGAVGTIAGVPETYKSWQAQKIAVGVAAGEGTILGHDITHQGRVGYFWQDDSTREEAERIKLYHRVHGTDDDLDVRWFLNEGLRLPEHIERLRHTVDHHGFILVVLDSFYNVLFGTDLKDDEAERVIAMLKSEVCDQTGCTILIVDHMPWATEQNRKRLRAYGGVHKGAAIRFGIYIDAVANKLYVEARGNNITGFNRRPAEWDADALELRLLDAPDAVGDDEYEQRILEYLAENPDTKTDHLDQIKGARGPLVAARRRLLEQKRLVRTRERTNSGPYLWNVNKQAEITSTTPSNEPLVLDDKYGGTTSTPRRGDVLDVLPPVQPADDDIPF